jgi:hypothetical protein
MNKVLNEPRVSTGLFYYLIIKSGCNRGGYKYHGFFTQMQMLINLYEVSIYTGTERATQERRDTWYRRMSASCRVDTPW